MEDDADDEKKKKYVAALKGDRKKATVEVNGVTKKVYELNNDEMEEALDKHDDPKDPLHQLRRLCQNGYGCSSGALNVVCFT